MAPQPTDTKPWMFVQRLIWITKNFPPLHQQIDICGFEMSNIGLIDIKGCTNIKSLTWTGVPLASVSHVIMSSIQFNECQSNWYSQMLFEANEYILAGSSQTKMVITVKVGHKEMDASQKSSVAPWWPVAFYKTFEPLHVSSSFIVSITTTVCFKLYKCSYFIQYASRRSFQKLPLLRHTDLSVSLIVHLRDWF